MKMKNIITALFIALILVSCTSATKVVPRETVIPTKTIVPTRKLSPVPTLTATRTPKPTPIPYDYRNIIFPIDIDGITQFKKNFNCPTTYGDNTHDGNDIMIISGKDVPVFAVDDGYIETSDFINDSVGYELHMRLGYDASGQKVYAIFVHMTDAAQQGLEVKKGDVIGHVKKPAEDHLHFEIRIGDKPKLETPSDGEPGNEIDVTDILINFVPSSKIGYDDRFGTVCK